MLLGRNDTLTPLFKQIWQGLEATYTPLNYPSKWYIFFYYLSIHALILITFIIYKQEQTLLFLKFRAHSPIYFNILLKVTDIIIRWSLNLIKKLFYMC